MSLEIISISIALGSLVINILMLCKVSKINNKISLTDDNSKKQEADNKGDNNSINQRIT